jgi:hypothetical protein
MTETVDEYLTDDVENDEMTIGDSFTCPLCFSNSYVTNTELSGYCVHCQNYSGNSPFHDEAHSCEGCGRPTLRWWVQDMIWDAVVGQDPDAMLCPGCFIDRATRAGVGGRGRWQIFPPAQMGRS